MSISTRVRPDFVTVANAFVWPRRELRLELMARGATNRTLEQLDELLEEHPDEPDRPGYYRSTLEALLREGDGSAELPLLLSVHLFRMSRNFWERSIVYSAVRGLRTEWAEALGTYLETADEWERAAGTVLLAQFAALSACMEVERTLNTGSPTALRAAAQLAHAGHTTVRVAADELTARPGCPDGIAPLMHDVVDDTRKCVAYYAGVVEAAGATDAYLRRDPDAAEQLAAAVATLEHIEDTELKDDRYGSELRAHRQTLEAMLAGLDHDRVAVEDTKVVYIFPFTLLDTAADLAFPTRLDALEYESGVAGIPVLSRHRAGLSEAWEAAPGSARYWAYAINLPPVTGTTIEGTTQEFTVEIRLGSLGNHYLRLETWLPHASLHDVYRTLRRGTAAAGAEQFTSAGQTWNKLADYATTVMEGFCDAVRAEGIAAELVGDSSRAMHVFAAPRVMRITTSAGSSRVATAADIPDAPWLHAFTYPIHTLAHSLAEWVRCRSQYALLSHEHGAIVRSRLSTLIALPGIPDFLFLEYEERSEFVASLPPLFEGWRRQLTTRADHVRALLSSMNDALEHAGESEDGSSEFAALEHEQNKLRALDYEIRTSLAALRSPSLCYSIEHRAALDAVLDAARVDLLEDDVTRALATLEHVFASTADAAQRIEQRYLRRLETLEAERSRSLKILADILGVASALAIVDYISSRTHMSNYVRIPVEVVTLLGVVLIIALYHRNQPLRWWKRPGRRRRRASREGSQHDRAEAEAVRVVSLAEGDRPNE